MKLTAFIAIIAFSLGFAAIGFCQGGPPPKVKERIDKSNAGINPFASEESIMDRFEKEMGVPKSVYSDIKTKMVHKEGGESMHDTTEKVQTDFLLIMICSVARVNQGERTGKYKAADRAQNVT